MSAKPVDRQDNAGDHDALPADFNLPRTRVSNVLDKFVRAIGRATAWLWVLLVLVIVLQVALRYLFNMGSIQLEELQWHIYAVGFILGLSYCLVEDRHVRVDVIAERLRPKTRAWIEMLGLTFLLLPFLTTILIQSVPYIWSSFIQSETSAAPGGLPYRWILKSFMFWGFLLLIIAALARFLRCTAFIFGLPRPIWPRD
ncbi:TRAP-type mannitol/chloroaromatic compound transporter [Caenispirillum salinarum AK4]|uniref:TRAP transporter small permease protein n=1 Tax=Caenispirillum salinarum AK4 TaxID=1238182 RepID=K9GWT3_9PROT|nr:TRAP transporter small permease subunit [Caenispirillum salinarum]EKV29204.1 TRAP-type mannitol/chloroaromatic compound transporter [Caenispirillum salinarum AK4]